MDTDKCIQRLVRTELEGSEHAQQRIEKTAQYWAMKEKEAAMNYHCTLELLIPKPELTPRSIPMPRFQPMSSYPLYSSLMFCCSQAPISVATK